ncbi:MAG: tetratricopeptide repeat protein [Alphaproteobacteria bacterium]|nr:tetratricopeptide repeat protein [Alphaproteobacteria bacterium]MDP6567702.1 tetratricopeptide repeat protein [Alphaproteobacteria bacterium]MDP6812704.1 tetratricopeptide repeat protein [Alphaproteobacteria bacterium]
MLLAWLLVGCATPQDGEVTAAQPQEPARVSPLGSYLAGRVARSERASDRAADFFDVARANDPDNRALVRYTLLLMLVEGRMQRALDLSERTLELAATRVAERSRELDESAENLAAAKRDLEKAKQDSATDKGDLERAEQAVELAAKDHERAEHVERALQRKSATNQSVALALLTLAAHEIRERDFDKARDYLMRTSRVDFMNLLQPILLAWVETGAGNREAAMTAFERLRKPAAFESFRAHHTALVESLLDRPEQAEVAFKETLSRASRPAARVILNYGNFLIGQGREEDARVLFDEFLRTSPEHPVILQAKQRLRDGEVPAPNLRSVADGAAEAFLSTAGVLARRRNVEAVRIYLNLALMLRPDLPAAYMLLAEVLESQRRFEDAIAAYAKIPETSAYHWDARIRTAANMNSLERIDDTVRLLRGMAEERQDDTNALITAANILRSHERYEEAASEYQRALARIETLQARHWGVLYGRGISLDRSKRWPEAEADFLKALDLVPDQPMVLNYLGYSWIEQGVKLNRAREMIEKAVAKRPNDGYIVDSLGWVFYRLGRYDQAVKHLERAVELRPEDPIINDHLGDAYWRAGRRLEARFQWNHAIALGAEADRVPAIQAKLVDGLGPPQTIGGGG